ncbi:probable calcium-binding protein CML22 [Aristolochia californica]|uniref:probable calcium-binding protein CML22 n=1 Tax=Aristolochia californica TaxID=171875 RepID=UPI0035D85468
MGSLLCYCNPPKKHKMLDPELEKKLVEAIKQRAMHRNRSFKSINSIIMKFPHFREGLRNIRHVFDRFDEDSNGTIDHKELNKCLDTLKIHLTEKEIDDLYHSCDVDGNEGIQYNEFIVLLCIIYLLVKWQYPITTSNKPSSVITHERLMLQTSNMGLPQLESIFEPILEAFLFLDKNSDGKLHKKDIVRALNDADGWERSPRHITSARFEEMNWARSGTINLKEFLFTFIDWIGIGCDEEMEIPITNY